MQKPALLIIDEWFLYPLNEKVARDLLEIIKAIYHRAGETSLQIRSLQMLPVNKSLHLHARMGFL